MFAALLCVDTTCIPGVDETLARHPSIFEQQTAEYGRGQSFPCDILLAWHHFCSRAGLFSHLWSRSIDLIPHYHGDPTSIEYISHALEAESQEHSITAVGVDCTKYAVVS